MKTLSFLFIYLWFFSTITILKTYSQATSTVMDLDSNIYKTVTIGTQVWMAENLKTKVYNDGSLIPWVIPPNILNLNKETLDVLSIITDTTWKDMTSPGYRFYEHNKEKYSDPYGAMYNFYAVNTGKLCPAGWHVPSEEEWTILAEYLGGWKKAGGKLKEAGTAHWGSPNKVSSKTTGFNAVAGGIGGELFVFMRTTGNYWTSTSKNQKEAKCVAMMFNTKYLSMIWSDKSTGFSVRCIKED